MPSSIVRTGVLALAVAPLLGGCAAFEEKSKEDLSTSAAREQAATAETGKAMTDLFKRLGEQVSSSQATLARAVNAQTVSALSEEEIARISRQNKTVPPGMDRAVTLTWNGPAPTAAEIVSETAGYAFEVQGRKPAETPIVHLRAEGERAIDVIREIGAQLGKRATMQVMYDGQRVVRLRYASAE